jgi:hypothetical protein
MKLLRLIALLGTINGYCSEEGSIIETGGSLGVNVRDLYCDSLSGSGILKIGGGTWYLANQGGERQILSFPGKYKITNPTGFNGIIELCGGVLTAPKDWIIEKLSVIESQSFTEEALETLDKSIACAANAYKNLAIVFNHFSTTRTPLAKALPDISALTTANEKLDALFATTDMTQHLSNYLRSFVS